MRLDELMQPRSVRIEVVMLDGELAGVISERDLGGRNGEDARMGSMRSVAARRSA